jgi:D-3-phosphoglycerate dehydrogenase
VVISTEEVDMRLSRWGRSPYETQEDLRIEREALEKHVEVLAEGADAEIVVVHSKITAGQKLLDAAPSLELLITTTSGTDHIDLGLMAGAGVAVCRLPGPRRDAVVEATMGMIIWGLRRFGVMDDWARRGRWGRGLLPEVAPRLLSSARVGVVGLGVIGEEIERRLTHAGAEVWGCDPSGIPDHLRASSIDEMLGHCDVVSLHCDLNSGSAGMISASRLAGAHPGLILVNTARGGLVDTAAALQAVQQGGLAGLCLDVFPDEPTDLGPFAAHPRVLVTPHAAGYHDQLADLIREDLEAVVQAWVHRQPLPNVVR